MDEKHSRRGFLFGLKARLQRNRLGELLVMDGALSPAQLKDALHNSKTSNQQLGDYLVLHNIIDKKIIRRTLTEQFALRFMLALVTVMISFASFGIKPARASDIKDVPALMQVANSSFAPIHSYPSLFGSEEKRSTNLKAFTKWSGMFQRFDYSFRQPSDQPVIQDFKNRLQHINATSLYQMAGQVNSLVNQERYILDSNNYGQTDYWATPVEFFRRGGDCEDFAIAKYTALRALGVPEERLRLVILQDMQKNVPHAILVVYTERGPVLLDNQIKKAVPADSVAHYKPIFSINRDAWWLHTKPDASVSVIASSTGE